VVELLGSVDRQRDFVGPNDPGDDGFPEPVRRRVGLARDEQFDGRVVGGDDVELDAVEPRRVREPGRDPVGVAGVQEVLRERDERQRLVGGGGLEPEGTAADGGLVRGDERLCRSPDEVGRLRPVPPDVGRQYRD